MPGRPRSLSPPAPSLLSLALPPSRHGRGRLSRRAPRTKIGGGVGQIDRSAPPRRRRSSDPQAGAGERRRDCGRVGADAVKRRCRSRREKVAVLRTTRRRRHGRTLERRERGRAVRTPPAPLRRPPPRTPGVLPAPRHARGGGAEGRRAGVEGSRGRLGG